MRSTGRTHGCEVPPSRRIARLLTLAILPLGLASCGYRETRVGAADRPVTAPPAATTIPQPTGVTLGDVLREPMRYSGTTVTVSGEVNDVLGPRAFTIGGEEFLPPGELLIVSKTDFPSIPDRPANEYLVDNDLVQVTGTVRTYVHAEVRNEVENAFEGETYLRWEGKPVLVASSVLTTARVRDDANSPATGVVNAERPITEKLEDKALTGAVKAALIANRQVGALDIDVHTYRNVVILKGTVETAAQKQEAARAARGVPGVEQVTNLLKVERPGTRR